MENNSNFNTIIIVMYGAMIVWLGYRLFKSNQAKKQLSGQVSPFGKKITNLEKILVVLLFASGVFNIYDAIANKNSMSYLTAAVMIVVGIVFLANSLTKIYIAENGILLNGKFYTYKELKKWGFDQQRGDLVILVKKDHQETREASQVKKEDITSINDLIRKYKLGK